MKHFANGIKPLIVYAQMRELTEGVCGCEEITRIELATDCARNLGYFSNTSVTEYNQTPPIPQQLGAGVARGAHNPEVTRSKRVVAIYFAIIFVSFYFSINRTRVSPRGYL